MTDAQQKVTKSIDALKSAKETWQKELVNVQSLNNSYIKGGRRDRAELDKQILVAKEANRALKKAIEVTNDYKHRQVQVILPALLEGIQRDEKARAGTTQDTLRQTCSYYGKTAPIITKVWGDVQATLDLLSSDMISDSSANKSTSEVTSPALFPDSTQSDFSFSDSTAEIQRKQELKTLTAPQPNIAQVSGGKKKGLLEKTKQVEKEIDEIQIHVDSVETLISVLREAVKRVDNHRGLKLNFS
jgi:hypothetical protein